MTAARKPIALCLATGVSLCLILLCTSAAGVFADTSNEDGLAVVRATGRASGNDAEAYRTAADNACMEALLQSLEALSELRVSEAYTHVLSNVDTYVAGRRVIKHNLEDDATVVDAECSIRLRALHRSVAPMYLAHLRDSLTAMVVIESEGGAGTRAERAVIAALKRAGIRVVSNKDFYSRHHDGVVREAMEAGAPALSRIARDTQVGALILGTVSSSTVSGKQVQTCQGHAKLVVVSGNDGKLLGTYTEDAALKANDIVTGSALATRDACVRAVPELVTDVALAGLRPRDEDGILITLLAPSARNRVEEVTRFLSAIDATAEVELLHYADARARLHLSYAGPVRELTELLTASRFSDFGLEARAVAGQEMELRVMLQ